MIHKIKALYDEGKGLSIRAIGRELGIARNTVRKYLQRDEQAICADIEDPSRAKRLDEHRDFLVNQLQSYPKLSAVKIARRLRAKVGELPASDRSIRRYVQALKQDISTSQLRYYEPIVDAVPGVQCQVDPGELRSVYIGGVERILHFVVFVLSCTRLMYVGVSFKPLDTTAFVQLHDEAFRYFGGVTEECVYDQTKMVVIEERYRDLTVNPQFHSYASAAGFRIHACEGYDPESKGKVEAGVKYVKQDCLYGETFADEAAVRDHVLNWLNAVVNARTHGTTGQIPQVHFEAQERAHLKPYLTPARLGRPEAGEHRRVDKTGLISWRGNKYSVPMAWQQARVGVCESAGEVVAHDLDTAQVIARHPVATEKGRIIKNSHHYRDHTQRQSDLENAVAELVGPETGSALCAALQRTSPRVYKDQLVAVRNLMRTHAPVDPTLMAELSQRPQLKATTVQSYLEAWQRARERGREVNDQEYEPASSVRADLQAYASVGHSSGQGVSHECA